MDSNPITYVVRACDPTSDKAWPRAVLFTDTQVIATDGKRLHIADWVPTHPLFEKPYALPMERLKRLTDTVTAVRDSYGFKESLDLAACFPPWQNIIRDLDHRDLFRTIPIRLSPDYLDLGHAQKLAAAMQREVWQQELVAWKEGLALAKAKDAHTRRSNKRNEKSYREHNEKPTIANTKIYMCITVHAVTIGPAAEPTRTVLLCGPAWSACGWPEQLAAVFKLRYVIDACKDQSTVQFEAPRPRPAGEKLTDPMCIHTHRARAYVMPCRF